MIQNVTLLQSFLLVLCLHTKQIYLQMYSENCAYKIANKQMTDYLGKNLFKDQIM